MPTGFFWDDSQMEALLTILSGMLWVTELKRPYDFKPDILREILANETLETILFEALSEG